jgi:RNA polymerase sigma factor (TIGR02999 family)
MTRGADNGSRASAGEITQLLAELGRGNETAREPLFESIYEELRTLAHARLRSERSDITLSTTGLVHEAYLKLVPIEKIEWRDRSHFFATAARAMRRVLIDHARAVNRQKRGGRSREVTLNSAVDAPDLEPLHQSAETLLALDEALHCLGESSPRQLRVVELRFFAGLSLSEIADILDVGVTTVKRDWSTARAWLNRELSS